MPDVTFNHHNPWNTYEQHEDRLVQIHLHSCDRQTQEIISQTAEIVPGQLQLADELPGSIYIARLRALTWRFPLHRILTDIVRYALKIKVEDITLFFGL